MVSKTFGSGPAVSPFFHNEPKISLTLRLMTKVDIYLSDGEAVVCILVGAQVEGCKKKKEKKQTVLTVMFHAFSETLSQKIKHEGNNFRTIKNSLLINLPLRLDLHTR